jgi:hypothetical protein
VRVAAVDRYRYAAYEGVWGCRLSYARIVEPVESPAMRRFIDRVPAGPWVHDWYSHIMFSERLLEAASALDRAQPTDSLGTAVDEFPAHWAHFKPLRDVLHHPGTIPLKLTSLRSVATASPTSTKAPSPSGNSPSMNSTVRSRISTR